MSSNYRTLNVGASAEGQVVTVELNRPEALNAMNTAMGEDLLRCFEGLRWDRTVRAVVFTGAGSKAFCVGGDLKEREGMTDEAWRAQHVIFEAAAAGVLHCPVPVIAAVEGFAMGGGCELAVLSDLVVCGETAVFAVPEEQARAKALEIAAAIADNGPIAVRQAKKAINWGAETDLETGMALAIEAYNNTVTTEDRLEGVRAFNEKRKPRFQGK